MAYKSKQIFFVLIKLILVIGAFYMIYAKVFKNELLTFKAFKSLIVQSDLLTFKNLTFVLGLTVLNWVLESKKWQILVNSFQELSFFEATKQSLSSLTSSLITPNRIGEYGAKVLYYNSFNTKRILFLNLIGNSTQLVATCVFGSLGLVFLTAHFKMESIGFNSLYIWVCIGLLFGFGVLGISLLKRFKTHNDFKLKTATALRIIALAFLRYLVFSFQFFLLTRLFNVELDLITTYACITSMYVLASIIPAISLFDVVIKSSIAVLIFELVGIESLPILVITLLMWLFNFAIPAIFGAYFVLNFKPKTTKL